jgi:adenine-specific DNA-methyltransferase
VAHFGGSPEELPDTFLSIRPVVSFSETQNLTAYLEQMLRLLRQDGVRFPDNRQMRFTRLEPLYNAGTSTGLHAEGRWVVQGQSQNPSPPAPLPQRGEGSQKGDAQRGEGSQEDEGPTTVGVAFGPQYGPVTAKQVEDLIRPASRRYEDLVIAGFSFDGASQAVIEEAQHPKLRIHMAHIRPDVNPGMNGLLKEQPGSQLFTVFGQPRTTVQGPDKHGEFTVLMEGVDIYNPVDNSIASARADKVAAWFLDSDYDGRTFCVTQAFFPDRTAWDKLAKALGDVIDPERFEALSGTVSLPFPPGVYKCVAVKVIDPRGNEDMQVKRL